MDPLTSTEIDRRLSESLPGWRREGDQLVREYRFDGFTAAMAFVQRLVPVADELNHHPTWTNTYNRVEIRLTTHDAGGLTELDFAFASRAEQAAAAS